jgi:hypothetical protein
MREVIVGEVLARKLSRTLLRAFAHRNGRGAVQFHDQGWLNPKQPVMKLPNLAPVRGRRRGTLGLNGRNGPLQRVGTEAAGSKSAFGERDAFGDLVPVPQRPILPLQ